MYIKQPNTNVILIDESGKPLNVSDTAFYINQGFEAVDELPKSYNCLNYVKPSLNDSLISGFETLSVQVRAAFRGVKTQVKDAVNEGQYEEAKLIISNTKVPVELEPVKQGFINIIQSYISPNP